MILVVAALCMTISTIVLASVFEEGGGDLIFHQKMKES